MSGERGANDALAENRIAPGAAGIGTHDTEPAPNFLLTQQRVGNQGADHAGEYRRGE